MKSLSRKSLQVFRPLLSRPHFLFTRTQKSAVAPENEAFIQKLSIHRTRLNLYDLVPLTPHAWVAPNATVIGQVIIGNHSTIWYNSVIRGDINEVDIGAYSSVGEHTVIHTASSLPNGRAASVEIGSHVTIQNNCSLYSCTIQDQALIGAKSVLLQGAHIGKGAVILPNSVVPPGRYVPSNQIWGGNPIEYIRDLNLAEQFSNYTASYTSNSITTEIDWNFQVWSSTYLKKETTKEDVVVEDNNSIEGEHQHHLRSHPEL